MKAGRLASIQVFEMEWAKDAGKSALPLVLALVRVQRTQGY
jgi:hypothetical protein